ncbi:MAG: hypothetical protein K2K02_04670 [Ruminococcus sp.]|nr:hypothetical protein [Ruminococcus sp.]
MKREIILFVLTGMILIIIALGIDFLIAWGIVALASKCFEFAFAWKYVWLIWFILSFVIAFFQRKQRR